MWQRISVFNSLRVEVGVEEERVGRRPPGVLVGDTPAGDRHAGGLSEASLHDGDVVVGRSVHDIELRDGDLKRYEVTGT